MPKGDTKRTSSTSRSTTMSTEIDQQPSNDLTTVIEKAVERAVEKSMKKSMTALKTELKQFCETLLDKMESRIFAMEEKVDDFARQLASHDEAIQGLKRGAEAAQVQSNKTEQYSRRNNINVHGVPNSIAKAVDSTGELAALLSKKLETPVSKNDIAVAHPIGKPRQDNTTSYVVKFHKRELRDTLMSRRRRLKFNKDGATTVHLVLQDNLTLTNSRLLKTVKEHKNCQQAWTWQGTVWALGKNERKMKVEHEFVDIDKLLN